MTKFTKPASSIVPERIAPSIRILRRLLPIAVVLAALIPAAFGTPLSDLSSPSQETRDAAASMLRMTYHPHTREQLAPLLRILKTGDRMNAVLERLQTIGAKQEKKKNDDGRTASFWYRLDSTWVLHVTFSAGALFDTTLIEDVQHVWVAPNDEFTGTWTAYYVNGQRWQTVEYKDGLPDGKWTTFYPDGSVRMVQHFGKDGLEGEEIGYYKTGTIEHRGSYKAGSQTGTWTWYNEDGTVHETSEL